MFRHHLDGKQTPRGERHSIRAFFDRLFEGFDWEDVFVFVHLTLAFTFVVWGLELILPFSVWRILVGLYLALWIGKDLIAMLWGKGIYILKSENITPPPPEDVDE